MLEVQTYLLTHSLKQLAVEHGIYARFSTKNPFKFSLNYDQLEARDADPLAQECRGLVLRTDADTVPMNEWDPTMDIMCHTVGPTSVLAQPMRRFFNHGQGSAATVDFATTRFYEKLDGTLCIVYWDRDLMEWSVATRSVPDADLPMDGFDNQTFSSLFWRTFENCGGDKEAMFAGWTYCFELCTPDNQIVVRHAVPEVYLIACRYNPDGTEVDTSVWSGPLCVKSAPYFTINSMDEMVTMVNQRDPSKYEGVVACDANFNRVKIKSAGYLALSKIKDSIVKSPRAVLEVILLGKEDDVFPLITERQQGILLDLKEKLRTMLVELDLEYERLYSADRKTFALAVQSGSGRLGPHMARWSGRCTSAHDWIMTNRRNGTWADGYLDSLLGMCR